MSDYNFSDFERYAVYSVHGQSCYLCKKPITLNTMHVDHIVPEALLDDRITLEGILKNFGLNDDFYINSFENWMPACAPCNLAKSKAVFNPTPMIQLVLQKAIDKAALARKTASEIVTKRKLSRALNTIMRAKDLPEYSRIQKQTIMEMAERFKSDTEVVQRFEVDNPSPVAETIIEEDAGIFRATPLHKVLFENGAMRMVEAPYGIGYQPKTSNPHSSFYCGHCGQLGPWQGAKCMTCGHLDDGD